jgi:hypothetical protein
VPSTISSRMNPASAAKTCIGGDDQVWWQQQIPVALGWLLRA